MTEQSLGHGTRAQILFLSKLFNSSCMAKKQNSSSKALFIFLGSIWVRNIKCEHSLRARDRVFTSLDTSPIVKSVRWSLMVF